MRTDLLLTFLHTRWQPVCMRLCILLLLAVATTNLTTAQQAEYSSDQEGRKLFVTALGHYQDLNELIYIGGIYLPFNVSDFHSEGAIKLEMRIVVQEMSARRFTRMWMDSISLNASREQRENLIDEIQTFGEIYQHKLHSGDHVAFTYDADAKGTHFLLNDVELEFVPGRELFNLLLGAWIGDRPISTELKAGLQHTAINGIQIPEIDEYYLYTYTESRQQEVREYSTIEERRLLALQEEELRLQQIREREQAEAEEAARLLEEQQRAEEAERLRLAQLKEERLRREAELLAQQRYEKQQLELKQTYTQQLIQWISRYVVYPDAALRRGVEGRVEIEITSDRDGNLLSRDIITGSGAQMLDYAAQNSVRNAEPLPSVPELLEGDNFSFVMPIAFILEK